MKHNENEKTTLSSISLSYDRNKRFNETINIGSYDLFHVYFITSVFDCDTSYIKRHYLEDCFDF